MSEQKIPASNRSATGEHITVRVLFFGAAREIVGHDEISLELQAPATATSAFEEVVSHYPALRRFGRSLLFAVNQEYATRDAPVREGDELAVFPPVSGGAGERDAETQGHGDAVKEKRHEQEAKAHKDSESHNDPES